MGTEPWAWSRTEQTASRPTSLPSPGAWPPWVPSPHTLTSSRARRKARGSFSARKVPAEASCGRTRRERTGEHRAGAGRSLEPRGSPAPACPVLSYLTHRVHHSPCSVLLPTGSLSNEVRGTAQKPPLGKSRRSGAGGSQARARPWESQKPAVRSAKPARPEPSRAAEG